MKASARAIEQVYDDTGTGMPVLFIHGHPFDRTMWRAQVEALTPGYRCVVPDVRGYGTAAIPERVTGLDEIALDLLALLDHLQLETVIAAGLSMGGQIAMELARLAPARLSGLVLADTDARAETFASRADRLAMADALQQKGMAAYWASEMNRFLARSTIERNPAVVEHVESMVLRTDPRGAANVQRGRAERGDYRQALSRLKVPALVIVGEEDAFTPHEVAASIHQNLADSELAVIPNSGHVPNLENVGAFNAVLLGFLQRVASARMEV